MKEAKDFEKKLKRLEEVVSLLEREDRPLEETITLFKEGMSLSAECRKTLTEVETSVSQVLGTDDNGEPVVKRIINTDNDKF